MKKTLLTLIFSSFFIISLYADNYVKVAAFSKTENFYGSVESIQALGFNAAYIEKQGVIRVFAGPFENSARLNSALLIIREKIAADAYPIEVSNVIIIDKAKTPSTSEAIEKVIVENEQEGVHKSLLEDNEESTIDEEPTVNKGSTID